MTLINTATEVISFARKLEQASAGIYEAMARKYPKARDVFQSCARQNSSFVAQFETAYYGAITDALEGGFAFAIESEQYESTSRTAESANYPAALRETIGMEDRLIKFYAEAAEQSGSLLSDVRRAFALIAEKRSQRQRMLESLLSKE